MDDLIEALGIFRRYLTDTNALSPLSTSHDTLWIMDIDPSAVSEPDRARLEELGFFEDEEAFCSYRFGSA